MDSNLIALSLNKQADSSARIMWCEEMMLEKLLLAIAITFCLNLFLGVRLSNKTVTAPSYRLGETPTRVVEAATRSKVPSVPAASIPW